MPSFPELLSEEVMRTLDAGRTAAGGHPPGVLPSGGTPVANFRQGRAGPDPAGQNLPTGLSTAWSGQGYACFGGGGDYATAYAERGEIYDLVRVEADSSPQRDHGMIVAGARWEINPDEFWRTSAARVHREPTIPFTESISFFGSYAL
jgi:hypothetical protein